MNSKKLRKLPLSKTERAIIWAKQAIQGYASQILGALGTITLATLSLSPKSWLPYWVIVGVLLSVVGLVFLPLIARPSYPALLQKERQAADRRREVEESLHDTLSVVLRHLLLDLNKFDFQHRASVYAQRGDVFVLLARCSANMSHARTGRKQFTLDLGAIGIAWSKGVFFKGKMYADRAKWNKQQVDEYGFTLREAAELTMQARAVAATRIEHGADPLGVLVLESELPEFLELETANELRQSLQYDCLAEFLNLARDHIPTVQDRHSAE